MRSGQQLIIAVGFDSNHGLGVLLAEVAEAAEAGAREPASRGSLLTSKPVSVFARSVMAAAAAPAAPATVATTNFSCCFY